MTNQTNYAKKKKWNTNIVQKSKYLKKSVFTFGGLKG